MRRIEGQHLPAKTFCPVNHMQADMPGANASERFLFQIKPHQAVPCKITARGAHVSAMNIARQRENQTENMFGNRVLAVKRHIGGGDMAFAASFQIEVSEACGTRRDQFCFGNCASSTASRRE